MRGLQPSAHTEAPAGGWEGREEGRKSRGQGGIATHHGTNAVGGGWSKCVVVGVGSINSSVTAKEEEVRLLHRIQFPCRRQRISRHRGGAVLILNHETSPLCQGYEEAQSDHGGSFNTAGHMDVFIPYTVMCKLMTGTHSEKCNIVRSCL